MASVEKKHILEGLFEPDNLVEQRDWEVLRDGVNISVIYDEGRDGPRAAFLHYLPGASVPVHEHVGYEHILILSGTQQDGKNVYHKGTLVIHKPGSQHNIRSPEGCIALGIWQKPVKFLS